MWNDCFLINTLTSPCFTTYFHEDSINMFLQIYPGPKPTKSASAREWQTKDYFPNAESRQPRVLGQRKRLPQKIFTCANGFQIIFVIMKSILFTYLQLHTNSRYYCFFHNNVTTIVQFDEGTRRWQHSSMHQFEFGSLTPAITYTLNMS